MLQANTHTLLVLSDMFWDPLCTNLAVLQMFMMKSVNSSLAHRQAVSNPPWLFDDSPSQGSSLQQLILEWWPHVLDLVMACLLYSHIHDENHYTIGKLQYVTYTQSHIHSSFDCKCRFHQHLPTKIGLLRALSLFGEIHGMIVNCYLASVSVNNMLPLSSAYQISPDIHCHLPEKAQSSTAGNNGAPTSFPLLLGHALY